jgi:hypothetical protein
LNQVNDNICIQNARLQQALSSISSPVVSTKLVSRTKLNFTLIPLGFTFEHTITQEQVQECPKKEHVTGSPKRVKTLFSLRIPAWFVGYQYTLCIDRATSGWRFHPRILTDIQYPTYFMNACKWGFVERVKHHITSNRNVVQDRHNGLTGLDVSVVMKYSLAFPTNNKHLTRLHL